jgi:hypothetical protein
VTGVSPLANPDDHDVRCRHPGRTVGQPDWSQVPVVPVPLHRFVVPLHDIQAGSVNTWHDDSGSPPVHAFTRWPDHGPVDISDGRHRVLRALVRGEASVPTRLLVIP